MSRSVAPPARLPEADAAQRGNGHYAATLVISSVAVFLIALEITVISVALPEIEAAFPSASRATLSWVFTAYNIGVASLLLLGGWMAERVGRRTVFLIGLAVFGIGSLGSGAAPTVVVLIGSRAVQSVGGALLIPASLALVLHAAPTERKDVAIGVWGAMAGLAAAVGPTLGALLVDAGGWRWVFLINVPIVAVAAVAARSVLEESSGGAGPVDPLAVPAGALGVGALVFAIVAGGPLGWGDPRVVLAFGLAATCVGLFLRRSLTHPNPVFAPELARRPSFAVGSAGMLFFVAGFTGWLVLAPTFLSEVWGYSVLRSGFAIAPGPVMMAVTAGPAGKACARFGYRSVIAAGSGFALAASLWWVWRVDTSPDFVLAFLPGTILLGIGVGIGFPMLTAASMRDVDPDRFAIGAAGSTTVRQLSMALGIAVAVAIVGSGDDLSAELARYQTSWVVCGGLFLVSGLVMAFRYPDPAPVPTREAS